MPTLSEDRDAIRDLLARYCLYFDQGAATEWAALYTEDGGFEGSGQHYRGRAELETFLAGLPPSTTHRITLNHVIDVDGDRAVCRSSVVILDGGVVISSGRVVDELVRAGDGWRIARRAFAPDPAPADTIG